MHHNLGSMKNSENTYARSGGYFARRVTVPVGSPAVLYSSPFKGSKGLRSEIDLQETKPKANELLEYGEDPRAPAKPVKVPVS